MIHIYILIAIMGSVLGSLKPSIVPTMLSTLGQGQCSPYDTYLCVGRAELGCLQECVEAVVPILAELVPQLPVAPGSRRTEKRKENQLNRTDTIESKQKRKLRKVTACACIFARKRIALPKASSAKPIRYEIPTTSCAVNTKIRLDPQITSFVFICQQSRITTRCDTFRKYTATTAVAIACHGKGSESVAHKNCCIL